MLLKTLNAGFIFIFFNLAFCILLADLMGVEKLDPALRRSGVAEALAGADLVWPNNKIN